MRKIIGLSVLVLSFILFSNGGFAQELIPSGKKEINLANNKDSKIYNLKMKSLEGKYIDFNKYRGKVILIVNTASKCGFTPQYAALEELNKKYSEKGLVILGFPCNQFLGQEPGENEEIKEFCTANYGVSFQMFEKIEVNGEEAAPLYQYLKKAAPFKGFDNDKTGQRLAEILKKYSPEFLEGDEIKWNFTKFLVSRDGKKIVRFESSVDPKSMENDIRAFLE